MIMYFKCYITTKLLQGNNKKAGNRDGDPSLYCHVDSNVKQRLRWNRSRYVPQKQTIIQRPLCVNKRIKWKHKEDSRQDNITPGASSTCTKLMVKTRSDLIISRIIFVIDNNCYYSLCIFVCTHTYAFIWLNQEVFK